MDKAWRNYSRKLQVIELFYWLQNWQKKLNIEIFEFDTSVHFLSHTFLTTTIVLIKFYFAVCGTGMA